jgi:hypothetical protein
LWAVISEGYRRAPISAARLAGDSGKRSLSIMALAERGQPDYRVEREFDQGRLFVVV